MLSSQDAKQNPTQEESIQIQERLVQRILALRITGLTDALIRNVLPRSNDFKPFINTPDIDNMLYNAIVSDDDTLINESLFTTIKPKLQKLRQYYFALKALERLLENQKATIIRGYASVFPELDHIEARGALRPLLMTTEEKQSISESFYDAKKEPSASATLKLILTHTSTLTLDSNPIRALVVLGPRPTNPLLESLEISRQRYHYQRLNQQITLWENLAKKVDDYLAHPLLEAADYQNHFHTALLLQKNLSDFLKEDIQPLGITSPAVTPLIKQMMTHAEKLLTRMTQHIRTFEALESHRIHCQALLDNLHLDEALAYLSHAEERLQDRGPDRIRFKDLREQIQARVGVLHTEQQRTMRDQGVKPALPIIAYEVAQLQSMNPCDLIQPKPHFEANIQSLFHLYKHIWETLRNIKQSPKGIMDSDNVKLAALGDLLKKDAQGKNLVDKVIASIVKRLDSNKKSSFFSLSTSSLTYGKKQDARGPAAANYTARENSNQDEVAYLECMQQQLDILHTEMSEIYAVESRKSSPTRMMSPFGGAVHTMTSASDFNMAIQDILGKPPHRHPSTIQTTTKLYTQALTPVTNKSSNVEIFSISTNRTDASAPTMYSINSSNALQKRVKDGILTIDPLWSDHYLMAKILEAELAHNRDNENDPIMSHDQCLEMVKQACPSFSLDSKESIQALLKQLDQDEEDQVYNFKTESLFKLASHRLNSEDARIRSIRALLDKERYDSNGMPREYYAQIALNYLQFKYQEVLNGRCPYPVNFKTQSKPIAQAMQLILIASPKVADIFKLDYHKDFSITRKQKKLATTPDYCYQYSLSNLIAQKATQLARQGEVAELPRGRLARIF